MSAILNSIEQYFDLDGSPLQNGYLYFGEIYGNPITNPVVVYFDAEYTIPAAQPVRTVNGYPVRSGTATGIYAPDSVSTLVQNSKKEQIIYIASSEIDTAQNNVEYRLTDKILTPDDNNKTFIALSPFIQTLTAAVVLGDRWSINYVNQSSGNIIINPNASETIDGNATFLLPPQKNITIYCDGVNFKTSSSFNNDTGFIKEFAGTSAPAGYLACPIAATNISRTTYAALFAAIGTTWGVGDGSTTFGMPFFPADYASIQANGNVGTSSTGDVKSHSHTVAQRSTGTPDGTTPSVGVGGTLIGPGSIGMVNTGGADNLAAGVRVLKCVKF